MFAATSPSAPAAPHAAPYEAAPYEAAPSRHLAAPRPGIIARRHHPDTVAPVARPGAAPVAVREARAAHARLADVGGGEGGVAYACVPSGTRRYYYPVYELPGTATRLYPDAQACWAQAFAPPPAGTRVVVGVGGARIPGAVRGYVSRDGWLRPVVALDRRPAWWQERDGDAQWYVAIGSVTPETPLPAVHPIECYDVPEPAVRPAWAPAASTAAA